MSSSTNPSDDPTGLSGPAVVNATWLDEQTVPSGSSLDLTKTFLSYDTTSRFLILVDGFAQCPTGVTQMDVNLNGDSIIPRRPLQTSSDGTTALSSNCIGSCTNAQTQTASDGSTQYINTITLSFSYSPSDDQSNNVPTISSISISMIPIAPAPSPSTNNGGGDDGNSNDPPPSSPILLS